MKEARGGSAISRPRRRRHSTNEAHAAASSELLRSLNCTYVTAVVEWLAAELLELEVLRLLVSKSLLADPD